METIKEEKKAELEQLLNSLIEKGWKPRGNQPEESLKKKLKVERYNRKPVAIVIKRPRRFIDEYYSFRELFSKESGLWQFVCDKGLVKKDGDINKDMEKYMYKCEYMDGCGNTINYRKRSKFTHHYFYEYFIIESALCDEDKLEEFLLSNIKVEGKND